MRRAPESTKPVGTYMYLYIMLLHNEDETFAGCWGWRCLADWTAYQLTCFEDPRNCRHGKFWSFCRKMGPVPRCLYFKTTNSAGAFHAQVFLPSSGEERLAAQARLFFGWHKLVWKSGFRGMGFSVEQKPCLDGCKNRRRCLSFKVGLERSFLGRKEVSN